MWPLRKINNLPETWLVDLCIKDGWRCHPLVVLDSVCCPVNMLVFIFLNGTFYNCNETLLCYIFTYFMCIYLSFSLLLRYFLSVCVYVFGRFNTGISQIYLIFHWFSMTFPFQGTGAFPSCHRARGCQSVTGLSRLQYFLSWFILYN